MKEAEQLLDQSEASCDRVWPIRSLEIADVNVWSEPVESGSRLWARAGVRACTKHIQGALGLKQASVELE